MVAVDTVTVVASAFDGGVLFRASFQALGSTVGGGAGTCDRLRLAASVFVGDALTLVIVLEACVGAVPSGTSVGALVLTVGTSVTGGVVDGTVVEATVVFGASVVLIGAAVVVDGANVVVGGGCGTMDATAGHSDGS